MAENRVGLGFVMSHSHAIRDLNDQFRRLQSKLESVSDKVGKVNSRTKTIKDVIVRVTGRRRGARGGGSALGAVLNPMSRLLLLVLLAAIIAAGAILASEVVQGTGRQPETAGQQ